jgi:enterochelin esterase-like enzyme
VQPPIVAKWQANAPLAMIDQYVSSLRQYTALAMDVGDQDQPIAGTVETLDQVLQSYGLRHEYEVYPGNHINRIAERVEKKVLPFFASHLKRPS